MNLIDSCPNGILDLSEVQAVYGMDKEYYEDQPLRGMFYKEQISSYYIAINTWLLLVKDWSPRFAAFLTTRIKKSGFRSAIDYCSDMADKLINSSTLPVDMLGPYKTLSNEVNAKIQYSPRFCNESLIGLEVSPTILQVLRFPKRYCPPHANRMVSEAIDDFIAWDNRVAQLWDDKQKVFYRNHNGIIMRTMKYIAERVLGHLPEYDGHSIEFTPNSTIDGDDTMLQKLLALLKDDSNYLYHPYSAPEGFFESNGTKSIPVSKIGAVPKNRKACRIIAPELCARQFRASAYADIIDRNNKLDSVDIHDQTKNQQWAQIGSGLGDFATIDSSHASDSISKDLASDIIPQRVWDSIEGLSFKGELIRSPRPDTRYTYIRYSPGKGHAGLVPDYYEISGERYRLHALSTAGNSLTFILESLIFAIISITAICLYSPERIDDKLSSFANDVQVYGDDIVISWQYAETLVDLLQLCGITVNLEKSFISKDLLYRESCGKEYFHGMDLTNVYISRHPLSAPQILGSRPKNPRFRKDTHTGESLDCLSLLVSLQHKLWDFSPASSSFLKDLICCIRPEMQIVPQGMADNSVWDNFVIPELIVEPYGDPRLGEHARDGISTMSCCYKASQPHCECGGGKAILESIKSIPMGLTRLRQLNASGWTESQLLSIIEIFLYEEFLRKGPKYSDPLMKLLGISDKPRKDKSSYLKRDTLVWRDDGRVPTHDVLSADNGR